MFTNLNDALLLCYFVFFILNDILNMDMFLNPQSEIVSKSAIWQFSTFITAGYL